MSVRIPIDDVLRVLRSAPSDGLTTVEVAGRLNANPDTVSARLSALASYGRIVRESEKINERVHGAHRRCRWSLPEDAHA